MQAIARRYQQPNIYKNYIIFTHLYTINTVRGLHKNECGILNHFPVSTTHYPIHTHPVVLLVTSPLSQLSSCIFTHHASPRRTRWTDVKTAESQFAEATIASREQVEKAFIINAKKQSMQCEATWVARRGTSRRCCYIHIGLKAGWYF